jgi:predicted flap endonuclease-1-like 5' DNA nuclease
MLRKSWIAVFIAVSYLVVSGFTLQNEQTSSLPTGWSALLVLLVVTMFVAILLIIQSHQTPQLVVTHHEEPAHEEIPDIQPETEQELVVAETVAEPESFQAEEAVAKTSVPAVDASSPIYPDDLTRIEGIGPKISELLNKNGISRYDQLAATDVETLKDLLNKGGPRFGLSDPSSWPEQASYLAAGEIEKFNQLSAQLKGGKRIG